MDENSWRPLLTVATHRADPRAAVRALAASSPRRAEQRRRLVALAGLAPETLGADISAIGDFARLLPTLVADAVALLDDASP